MMAIWTIVTVLYRPAVAPDQPWASRRLVPFVLPGLILGGIWAAAWLKEQAAELGRTRATAVTIASCCAASMLIPTALTTLDLSFTKANGVDAHGMAFRKIGTGELTAVGKLCRRIGPAPRWSSSTSSPPTGLPRSSAASATPPPRSSAIPARSARSSRASRRPAAAPCCWPRTKIELPGSPAPREVVNLLTTQEAHNLTAPPTRTWLIHYTVWMMHGSSPALAA